MVTSVEQPSEPVMLTLVERMGAKLGEGMWAIGLHHLPDGITNLKYKLPCLTTIFLLQREVGASF
jgi:hypothetical protein